MNDPENESLTTICIVVIKSRVHLDYGWSPVNYFDVINKKLSAIFPSGSRIDGTVST